MIVRWWRLDDDDEPKRLLQIKLDFKIMWVVNFTAWSQKFYTSENTVQKLNFFMKTKQIREKARASPRHQQTRRAILRAQIHVHRTNNIKIFKPQILTIYALHSMQDLHCKSLIWSSASFNEYQSVDHNCDQTKQSSNFILWSLNLSPKNQDFSLPFQPFVCFVENSINESAVFKIRILSRGALHTSTMLVRNLNSQSKRSAHTGRVTAVVRQVASSSHRLLSWSSIGRVSTWFFGKMITNWWSSWYQRTGELFGIIGIHWLPVILNHLTAIIFSYSRFFWLDEHVHAWTGDCVQRLFKVRYVAQINMFRLVINILNLIRLFYKPAFGQPIHIIYAVQKVSDTLITFNWISLIILFLVLCSYTHRLVWWPGQVIRHVVSDFHHNCKDFFTNDSIDFFGLWTNF